MSFPRGVGAAVLAMLLLSCGNKAPAVTCTGAQDLRATARAHCSRATTPIAAPATKGVRDGRELCGGRLLSPRVRHDHMRSRLGVCRRRVRRQELRRSHLPRAPGLRRRRLRLRGPVADVRRHLCRPADGLPRTAARARTVCDSSEVCTQGACYPKDCDGQVCDPTQVCDQNRCAHRLASAPACCAPGSQTLRERSLRLQRCVQHVRRRVRRHAHRLEQLRCVRQRVRRGRGLRHVELLAEVVPLTRWRNRGGQLRARRGLRAGQLHRGFLRGRDVRCGPALQRRRLSL